jgi:hypothetical protein
MYDKVISTCELYLNPHRQDFKENLKLTGRMYATATKMSFKRIQHIGMQRNDQNQQRVKVWIAFEYIIAIITGC